MLSAVSPSLRAPLLLTCTQEPYEHWKTEKAKKKKKKRGRPSMAPSDDPWDTDGETPDRSVAGHMSKSGELDAFRSQFEKHRKEMEEWKRQFMDQPPVCEVYPLAVHAPVLMPQTKACGHVSSSKRLGVE